MKTLIAIYVCLATCFTAMADPRDRAEGDYVEVRSNHVYTCGCLYSGESVTSGTEAVLAWNFRKGVHSNLQLDRVKAAAVIVGSNSLSAGEGSRQTALYLDGVVSEQQEEALVSWFQQKYPDLLGEVVAVKKRPIQFDKTEDNLSVEVGSDIQLTVRRAHLPEDAHLGSQQWYQPFTELKNTELSTVLKDEYSGDEFGRSWRRWRPRIAAFTGEFSVP